LNYTRTAPRILDICPRQASTSNRLRITTAGGVRPVLVYNVHSFAS